MATRVQRRPLILKHDLKDKWLIEIHSGAAEYIAPRVMGADGRKTAAKPPSAEEIAEWNKTSKRTLPKVAGYNDALACFCVVKELCTVMPGFQFTAKMLGFRLAQNARQYVWTPTTVGRILSGIADLAITEAKKRDQMPYFDMIRVASGNTFVLWDGIDTYRYFHALLRALIPEITSEETSIKMGFPGVTRDSIWLEITPDFSELD